MFTTVYILTMTADAEYEVSLEKERVYFDRGDEKMIPIYRAKSKEQENIYVEGLLICVDEETNLCTIRTKDDYIGGEVCYLDTLSINFSNMLDVKDDKIFASLNEDGKGGDILFDMEYEYTLSFDGLKFMLQGVYTQSNFNKYDSWKDFDIIGIEE